ncbi:MAG TPA: glycosyltransferase family 4 protein [Candidatus Polarisedimenticolaceae bacterium]|nr:glycosyltransferase family 4 protein [Candidatus Polarisedimenticolaceae bacterium]
MLALTRYARRGASSRLRTLQFIPGLASHGIEVVPRPLLDDAFLERRYAGARVDVLAIVRAYATRAAEIRRDGDWDLVWLEKEAFPWLPAGLERALARYRVPYVVELDDAWFHRYDLSTSPFVRSALGRKLDAVMREAATVIAGNAYIAERAREAGAPRVEIVPTCVDVAKYSVPPPLSGTIPFTVGWIGTPLTACYLDAVAKALARLTLDAPLRLLAVGAQDLRLAGVAVEPSPWSEETEAFSIARFDVGIMPLPDSPWERGKCGYKLLQCMASGKPVVASPVGVNASIVRHGENGFLAGDEEGWVRALRTLRDDPALSARLGEAGRQLIHERFSVATHVAPLARILREAASR